MTRFLPLIGACAALLSAPASAALTRPEQVMVQTVDAEQQRTLAMLERWVDQNSGTMNVAGVRAVRDMVEPELRQLGFTTQWIDMAVVRCCSASTVWTITCSGRVRAVEQTGAEMSAAQAPTSGRTRVIASG